MITRSFFSIGLFLTTSHQWWSQEINEGMRNNRGSGRERSTIGVQGQRVEGLGDKVPQKLKHMLPLGAREITKFEIHTC